MNMRPDVFSGAAAEAPQRLLDRPAERLVVTGFRCWMAGYEYGSIECWEVAWNAFATDLGTSGARRAFGDLQYFVRAIRQESCRTIECFPYCCNCVCRDECMALSIISALQKGDADLARTAAHYLTGATRSVSLDAVIEAAAAFAGALTQADRHLVQVTPGVVETIANHDTDARRTTRLMH